MSVQPKPTGEWTWKRIALNYENSRKGRIKLANDINAALAAERQRYDKVMDSAMSGLEKQLATEREQLEAWHRSFGTTQLTHAVARLESAEKKLATAVELAKGNITGCGTCWTISKIVGK